MIARPRGNIVNGVPDGGMVESCIREHLLGLGRMEKLRAYYDGRHAIDARIRSTGLPNLRMTHAFPRYISTMAAVYLIGNPVRYECVEEIEELDNVLREYRRCATDSVDA